jgi:hypothetical protein
VWVDIKVKEVVHGSFFKLTGEEREVLVERTTDGGGAVVMWSCVFRQQREWSFVLV